VAQWWRSRLSYYFDGRGADAVVCHAPPPGSLQTGAHNLEIVTQTWDPARPCTILLSSSCKATSPFRLLDITLRAA
jgi:hypothetical protein